MYTLFADNGISGVAENSEPPTSKNLDEAIFVKSNQYNFVFSNIHEMSTFFKII